MSDPGAARPAGFVDALARAEFIRLAAIVFLVATTNQQYVILAVVWQEAGFPHADIGLLLSIYGLPLVVLSLFSGTVANRIGILQTVWLGAVLTTLGMLSLYLTYDGFWGSLASRLLQGCGFALFHAPAMTYGTTRLTIERFVRLFGLLSAMAPLPYAFGPALAELVYHGHGPRVFFVAAAVPGLLALPLLFFLRPVARAAPEVGGLRRLIASPRIALPVLSAAVFGAMFGFIAAFIAPVMLERGLSIGAFFTTFTLSIFGVRLGLLGLLENVDRRLVVAGGGVLLGIGLMLAAVAHSVPMAVASGLVFGLGHSISFPVLSAWICDGVPPHERATPLALFNATFFFAICTIAFPASIAIARFGYAPTMIGLGFLGFALALMQVVAWIRRFR